MVGSILNTVALPGVENHPSSPASAARGTTKSFQTFLVESLQQVNQQQIVAEQLNEQLALGQVEHLHDVLIASEKAGLSLQMVIQIRNRVVEAYQEIMRMQI